MRFLGWFLFPLIFFTTFSPNLNAQEAPKVDLSPETGFYIESADGFMGLKISSRLQQQFGFTVPLHTAENPQAEVAIRRARARIHGYFFENELTYFLQIQMDRGSVILSNAEFTWKATEDLKLSFGQLWPVAGRQFRTASHVFQMIDRSTVSKYFSPGYDIGAVAQYNVKAADDVMLKTYLSVTHGEGMNKATAPGGFAYTGRVEFLPFGNFVANGDYSESDMYREKSPKLSIGAAYYLNQDAYTTLGNEWDERNDNIITAYLDAVFKYNGFSILGEYIHRDVQNQLLTKPNFNTPSFAKKTGGNGYFIQAGKFISNSIEPVVRVSFLQPTEEIRALQNQFTKQNTYTIGLNNFMRGHAIKLQFELNFIDEHYLQLSNRQYFQFLSQFSISF